MGATADDIVEIGEKLSNDCDNLSMWMERNRFKLNAGKTHLLTMGTSQRIRNLENELTVVMEGVTLKEKKEKCELLLGVYIQSE